ncbi:hypothetical protein MY11210_001447 [Beauveria gryllotalpidicola]
MFIKAATIIALATVLTLTTALQQQQQQQQQPLNSINNNANEDDIVTADELGPVPPAEEVEFLGWVNDTQVFDTDCPQWPRDNQAVKIGEVWREEGTWFAQPLKWWNHRHIIEPGLCIETRFGWDSDTGQIFYAMKVADSGNYSEWTIKGYANFGGSYSVGYVGWNADKARWVPCTNVPGCGGGSRFAMHKGECFRARIKTGRVITVCKTYTNEGNRICGEYSRKHHGRNRCGTGRDSHYWFGTETGCWEN